MKTSVLLRWLGINRNPSTPPSPGTVILLEDGVSAILLEDGTSKVLQES